ncbi:hypothetical protein GTY40_18905 [Streptomyces sp. SID8359]|uniref:hypothetical protein n=1 Tax=unclassified Streptomyces TaxID=2593676 RepID=UPI0012FEBE2A|nr:MULTISPECIES: hypothetical protein [unclassified Streptomyces]MYT91913.1 hypothetical protein [Streptomyces sp. SID8359]MYT93097.1 hypothetical protein [Streptomyces sp. SID8359]
MVWIRWRDDPEQLGQDLAQAAHILGLPESRLEEARTGRVSLVDAVWEHLAGVKGWLIVVDNVDAPSRVGPGRGRRRPTGGGCVRTGAGFCWSRAGTRPGRPGGPTPICCIFSPWPTRREQLFFWMPRRTPAPGTRPRPWPSGSAGSLSG